MPLLSQSQVLSVTRTSDQVDQAPVVVLVTGEQPCDEVGCAKSSFGGTPNPTCPECKGLGVIVTEQRSLLYGRVFWEKEVIAHSPYARAALMSVETGDVAISFSLQYERGVKSAMRNGKVAMIASEKRLRPISIMRESLNGVPTGIVVFANVESQRR